MAAKFLSQSTKQTMIKTVLWFLDANKRRRLGLFHQKKICKHLERSVRHLPRIERVFESTVVEFQNDALVNRDFGFYALHSGDFPGNFVQNRLELVVVFSFHVLNDIANVVPMNVQVSLWACCGNGPRGVWVKIGQIPSLQKITEASNPWMLSKRSQGCDSKLPKVSQFNILFAGIFCRYFLALSGSTASSPDQTFPFPWSNFKNGNGRPCFWPFLRCFSASDCTNGHPISSTLIVGSYVIGL